MSFLGSLPRPFFVLAPMDDVTDTVFRQIIAELAPPDVYFTEFVNVDGLQSPGRPRLIHKLKFSRKQHPIVAQLWGLDPDNFYKTTKELIKMGFDGVDLNMGCPVKTVTKNGACAALINNRGLAGEIIDATIAAVSEFPSATQAAAVQGVSEARKGGVQRSTPTADRSSQRSKAGVSAGGAAGSAGRQASAVRRTRALPVSVKTRVGFTTTDLTWIEFLLGKKLDLLSIHGRTAKQLSKVPANWDLIGEARQLRDDISPSTLIVGNGDVANRRLGLELAKQYQLDGIMIGRGIFSDPFAFASKSLWPSYSKKQRLELYQKHIRLFDKTWQDNQRRIETLNKFCKVYINGFAGAAELRQELMQAHSAKQSLAILKGTGA